MDHTGGKLSMVGIKTPETPGQVFNQAIKTCLQFSVLKIKLICFLSHRSSVPKKQKSVISCFFENPRNGNKLEDFGHLGTGSATVI